jgi:hypothetical protein
MEEGVSPTETASETSNVAGSIFATQSTDWMTAHSVSAPKARSVGASPRSALLSSEDFGGGGLSVNEGTPVGPVVDGVTDPSVADGVGELSVGEVTTTQSED